MSRVVCQVFRVGCQVLRTALATVLGFAIAGPSRAVSEVAGDFDDFGSYVSPVDDPTQRPVWADAIFWSGNNNAYHGNQGEPMDTAALDWDFGHTFEGIPVLGPTTPLYVQIRLRAGSSGSPNNDALRLQYTGIAPTSPDNLEASEFVWSKPVRDFNGGSWTSGNVVEISLDLRNLPDGGFDLVTDATVGTNALGYLDIAVMDDSWVDWIILTDCEPGSAGLCGPPENTCDDGFDNDQDGPIDCADTDCQGVAGCGEIVCDDGIDNDSDVQIDCADTDCAGVGSCPLSSGLPLFSLRPPQVVPFDESALLSSPPLVEIITAGDLGLSGGGSENLNAFSSPAALGVSSPPLGLLHFSVSRTTAGVDIFAPDVFSEATAGQAAGDLYTSSRVGVDNLSWNQTDLGIAPALHPGMAASPPIDDVDALDLPAAGSVGVALFALETGHPYTGASSLVGCGGDLFTPGPPATPTAAFAYGPPGTGMGLLSCLDDVDALHFSTGSGGHFYFSLAPLSPSLAPGSPIAGCATGCSAADIFVVATGTPGFPSLFATASDLGLLPTDDVDAIAWPDCAAPGGPDADVDGVADSCDNCLGRMNAAQDDTDADGYGNRCDADYNQDLITGAPDFVTFRDAFPSSAGTADFNPNADHTVDAAVAGPDYSTFRALFTHPPGPSGLLCQGVVPCTWP